MTKLLLPAFTLLLFPAVVVRADDAKETPTSPGTAELRQWVRELGASRFAAREAAGERLRRAGFRATEVLADAVGDKDLEISRRALRVLNKLIRDGLADNRAETFNALGDLATHANEEVSRWAVAILRQQCRTGTAEARATLRRLVSGDDRQLAARAGAALEPTREEIMETRLRERMKAIEAVRLATRRAVEVQRARLQELQQQQRDADAARQRQVERILRERMLIEELRQRMLRREIEELRRRKN